MAMDGIHNRLLRLTWAYEWPYLKREPSGVFLESAALDQYVPWLLEDAPVWIGAVLETLTCRSQDCWSDTMDPESPQRVNIRPDAFLGVGR